MNTPSGRPCALVGRHERGGAPPETDTVICLDSWTRALRDHRNLTRRQAETTTGISYDYLRNIETGGMRPSRHYLEKLINGYGLDRAQARLTWDLWQPPVRLPPVAELQERVSTPDRLVLLELLDRSEVATAYVDPLWNILAANTAFFKALPGVRTGGNVASWALPPAPQQSPAESLLLDPGREGRWLVGMLRGAFARYRASPQTSSLHQQLSHNTAYNHHWHNSIHVAYGRHRPLRLRNPTTHQPYTRALQITEITDCPAIRGFLAWPAPTPVPR